MTEYNVAYYVNNNIQHFPPVNQLQATLPGLILVRGEKVLDLINTRYPGYSDRTYLVRHAYQGQRLLRKHRIRLVIYPAFQNLNRGLAVEIFHGGLSDKRYLENVRIARYDLVLFPGKKSRDKVENANLLDKVIKWKIIGYPKFDPLRNNTLQYTPVFDNGNPTILYAPTWISITKPGATTHRHSQHGESSLPLWGLNLLKNIPSNINLIVKFHCLVHEGGDTIHNEMEQYVKDNNLGHRIRFLYDDNILQYMAQSEIMISDISSACYEWFHFDRPIIFANPAPDHYEVADDISANTYAWQTGDVINKVEDISRLIEKNLNADEYREKRNEIFNYSLYKPDGNATQRQADAIKELYDEYRHIPYWWFSIKMVFKHFGRVIYVKLIVKRALKK